MARVETKEELLRKEYLEVEQINAESIRALAERDTAMRRLSELLDEYSKKFGKTISYTDTEDLEMKVNALKEEYDREIDKELANVKKWRELHSQQDIVGMNALVKGLVDTQPVTANYNTSGIKAQDLFDIDDIESDDDDDFSDFDAYSDWEVD